MKQQQHVCVCIAPSYSARVYTGITFENLVHRPGYFRLNRQDTCMGKKKNGLSNRKKPRERRAGSGTATCFFLLPSRLRARFLVTCGGVHPPDEAPLAVPRQVGRSVPAEKRQLVRQNRYRCRRSPRVLRQEADRHGLHQRRITSDRVFDVSFG